MNIFTTTQNTERFAMYALLAVLFIAGSFVQSASAAETVTLKVDMNGTTRDIVIQLDEANAPKTCANFKKLAGQGFYDGIAFHRVIPNYIVQAGDPLTKNADHRKLWGTGGPGYTIPAEIGMPHERGSIAMARLGDSVNPNKASSGSQFYIALARIPKLDREYTVFGKVISGLDFLDQIAKTPTDSNNNPSERIEIAVSSVNGNASAIVNKSQISSPPEMAKVGQAKKAATGTIASDSEPQEKKESWFKRKLASKKQKKAEKMAAAELDESTPEPSPVAKKEKKPLSKTKAPAKPAPAAKIAKNTSDNTGTGDPSYRNDNLVDSRSAMTAPAVVTDDGADDAGISLSDEMKMKTVKEDADVKIREDKERGFVGRLLYRYW